MPPKEEVKELVRPENLADLKGKPKRLYKLLKAGLLHEADLDLLHDLGFPDEPLDGENDLHLEMQIGIAVVRKNMEQDKALKAEALRQGYIFLGTKFLIETAPMVDPSTVPDAVLEELGVATEQVAEQSGVDLDATGMPDPVTILAYDEEELAFISPSGEIVGFANAPRADLERRNILEWVGERITTAQARKAGIMAEKDVWQRKIDRQYNPSINKQSRIEARLKALYEPVGKAYLDELIANYKGKTPLRSAKVGLLMLQYGKTSARVDIVDEEAAIKTAEKEFPEAIKTVKSILKSQIPADKKKTFTEDQKNKSGIFWYPGGEDEFNLK